MLEDELYKSLINVVTFFNRTDQDRKLISDAGIKLEATSLQAFISIGRMQPTNVSELANVLGKSHSSVSRQIDKLEQHGLVQTVISKKDARFRSIVLSKIGERMTDKIDATRHTEIQRALSDWTQSDKEDLLENIERLSKTLNKLN